MDRFLRDLAPLSARAWGEVEEEASRSLRHYLTARRLVDFTGPEGWEHAAVNLGRVDVVDEAPAPGVVAALRRARPLAEVRVGFTLERAELAAIDRGAGDADLDPVIDAARRAAVAEDRAVFRGWPRGAIPGIAPSSPHEPVTIGDDYDEYPGLVALAVEQLREVGIGPPYGIALGPRCYRGVVETTERGGLIVMDHLRAIVGGPVVPAPDVDGALVVSLRGGDFELVCGQDVSLGYLGHDASTVELYLEESFTFLVHTPEAAVRLAYVD